MRLENSVIANIIINSLTKKIDKIYLLYTSCKLKKNKYKLHI